MDAKIRYLYYLLIIISFSILISESYTSSRYFSSVDVEKNIIFANDIFVLSRTDDESNTYNVEKGGSISTQFQLSNTDENGLINNIEMNYYLSMADENGNIPALEMSVENYSFVEGKGFGPIVLAHDGETNDFVDLALQIICPAEYNGESTLNYKLKVLAEYVENTQITDEKTFDIVINITDANNNSLNTNSLHTNMLAPMSIDSQSLNQQNNVLNDNSEEIQENVQDSNNEQNVDEELNENQNNSLEQNTENLDSEIIDENQNLNDELVDENNNPESNENLEQASES